MSISETLVNLWPVIIVALFATGVKIVRPIEVGLVETLGKYNKTAQQGFNWIIPFIQRMVKVNMTEQMVDVHPQTVITKDNLNAIVDAVVYYKIKDAQASQYNVSGHEIQLVSLARTTLRAVIGKMTLTQANENRDEINTKVEEILDKETNSYGVEVLRVEIQKIEPPRDVQEAMNEVVKAERKKIAANDLASAAEIQADGERRAEIKKAEGQKQGKILTAEGKAKAIELENEALNQYFKDQAEVFKRLDVAENSLKTGTKYVIDSKSNITNVITDVGGILPLKK